jgi:hypothetical protein
MPSSKETPRIKDERNIEWQGIPDRYVNYADEKMKNYS